VEPECLLMQPLSSFVAKLPRGDLWIFGYGSLMWNPGFDYLHQQPARLHGYHRSLCIASPAHRGTPQQPGLVMGLARGGSCLGSAFLVARCQLQGTLQALWEREMCDGIYRPRLLPIRIAAESTRALAFTVDFEHDYYLGDLPAEEIARRVLRSSGERGPNIEYLFNTVGHLQALGVRDRRLHEVLAAVRRLNGVPSAGNSEDGGSRLQERTAAR
jgi:glutathione-specific gamma-glutamylcyclotransferase